MDSSHLLCGVCEGFYGQPWSKIQRMDLFDKMQCMGLNTYLYAPKDDSKHRLDWRSLYNKAEQEDLRALISAAKRYSVTFVYALSPGVDICYSSKRDLRLLKEKLDQVSSLGCTAFALLFDDIDCDLALSDREQFHSFADAQSHISNIIYTHLGKPKIFLFCPTEYCSSRCLPDIGDSEYLQTLGKQLISNISVLWTGNRVISQRITVENIKTVSTRLKRKPLIWDNLHANDYDKTRIFLGPYEGRSTEILPYISGVLSNPNCEYGANFVAFHTLAQWLKNTCCGFNFCREDGNNTVNSNKENSKEKNKEMNKERNKEKNKEKNKDDVKIEATGSGKKKSSTDSLHCDDSLTDSASEFDDDFFVTDDDNLSGREIPPTYSEYKPKIALKYALMDWIPEFYRRDLSVRSYIMHNCDSESEEESPQKSAGVERRLSPRLNKNREEREQTSKTAKRQKCKKSNQNIFSDTTIRVFDLITLVDLHYLPFTHGPRAIKLLKEAHWLINNTERVQNREEKNKSSVQYTEMQEWYERALQFEIANHSVSLCCDKLMLMHNRTLLYELYHYISDIRSVISTINSYIKFQGAGKSDKDLFCGEEQEPWIHRGGIHAEFRRLLPNEGANDLFPPKQHSFQNNSVINMLTVRPCYKEDQDLLTSLCLRTYADGLDGSDSFPEHTDLAADLTANALLHSSMQSCLLLEDTKSVCGYFLSVPDVREYLTFYKEQWMPRMQKKYPKPDPSPAQLTAAEEACLKFYEPVLEIPDDLYREYPGFMCCNVIKDRLNNVTAVKQLIKCGLRSLSRLQKEREIDPDRQVLGVHTLIHVSNINLISWHLKYGFVDVSRQYHVDKNMLVLAKHL